jgi:AraC family transcriptional regulator, transcriptional activator FtrA
MIDNMSAKAAKIQLPARARTVAVVAFDGLALFEFAIACEIFGYPDPTELGESAASWYQLSVCSPDRSPVTLDNGLTMSVAQSLATLRRAGTVVVPACDTAGSAPPEVLAALRAAHARGARIVSLCTGAFVLAAAGLLDGRRVTTHWAESAQLAHDYPAVTVDPDVLYLDDGDILTSAGSAAGVDLCLHVVRSDYGAEVATRLARQLVVPPYRDGGQAQYIETPLPEPGTHDLFADTIAWLQEHLDEPVSVADLARRSAMSRRTFARRFMASTATTPYQWLLRQRLQRAQGLLETTDLSIELVAERSGFVTAANLRKHFARVLRTSPQAYRNTFQARASA